MTILKRFPQKKKKKQIRKRSNIQFSTILPRCGKATSSYIYTLREMGKRTRMEIKCKEKKIKSRENFCFELQLLYLALK